MATLNGQKPTLLNQVGKQPNIDVSQLVKLLQTYDDLSVNDFRGVVSDMVFDQLLDAMRDPNEVSMWNQIMNAPHSTPQEIQNTQRLVSTYIMQYPSSSKAGEAQSLMNSLQEELNRAIEEERIRTEREREFKDWNALDKGNYGALQSYLHRYPNSAHLDELDDLMWTNTKNVPNQHSFNRYLTDWPVGKHAAEANKALAEIYNWEEVKHSGDIYLVDDYLDTHPDSPFIGDIRSTLYKLREEMLRRMKENPAEYGKDDIEKLVAADIFKLWQLQDEGLLTEESWETLQLDRDLFPNIQDYQIEDPNIQAPEGCTDIYLFGTPGTGKTCLLMGLTGANGNGYTLNMKTAGGPYASALQQYVNAGITPGRTFGRFVTTINGRVSETDKHGNICNHNINLVEMSGEEFALRIADGKEVSLANMGTGATNLLRNSNRKVFFIIVDSTKDMVKVEYVEQMKDAEGNVIDERIRKKYISQLDILNKFVGLFELEENQDIMEKVDAIHFVVTKADTLGGVSERKEKARDLLLEMYTGPVETLKTYCRMTKRINYSTNYRPQVFTFSLGKFFVGDVFSFDKTETVNIIDTIRTVTSGEKEKTWWDRLKESIG